MARTVLIVEDNELNMKLFSDIITSQGYEVVQTYDGNAALPLAVEHRPDLVIMDIQLSGISGLDVTKWLKEDDRVCHIPVIAVTAFAMKGDEQRFRDGGCDAYISKPISVKPFIDTVNHFIASGAST
jgi:two-component system cell cycle response regulator DivK